MKEETQEIFEEIVNELERVARCDDADLAYSAKTALGALRSGDISLEAADEWLALIREELYSDGV